MAFATLMGTPLAVSFAGLTPVRARDRGRASSSFGSGMMRPCKCLGRPLHEIAFQRLGGCEPDRAVGDHIVDRQPRGPEKRRVGKGGLVVRDRLEHSQDGEPEAAIPRCVVGLPRSRSPTSRSSRLNAKTSSFGIMPRTSSARHLCTKLSGIRGHHLPDRENHTAGCADASAILAARETECRSLHIASRRSRTAKSAGMSENISSIIDRCEPTDTRFLDCLLADWGSSPAKVISRLC